MMKIAEFDIKLIQQAKAERIRLRLIETELSNESLAKSLGYTVNQIKSVTEGRRYRKSGMSRFRAIEIANMIRLKKCPMSLFLSGKEWQLVETSLLADDDVFHENFIATYNDKVTAQQIFNDAR